MKLLAYKLSGNTISKVDGAVTNWIKTVGIELETYDDILLNGIKPFIVINDNDLIPEKYEDISTICNWDKFGNSTNLRFNQIRNEISNLRPTTLSGLTNVEIQVINNFKLNEYYQIFDNIHYTDYDYDINATIPPLDLDYNLLGFHKKRYFDKGELYKVEYYSDYDDNNDIYSSLAIKEDRLYYRINESLHRREMDISWYLNSGVSGTTKHTTKFYTIEEAISAGERRRRNVVSNLKINTIGLIMMVSGITQNEAETVGKLFVDEISMLITKYIEGVETPLKNEFLSNSNHEWLDGEIPNTGGILIRYFLYDNVDIDYTVNNIYV